jgi:hypothetical protein
MLLITILAQIIFATGGQFAPAPGRQFDRLLQV